MTFQYYNFYRMCKASFVRKRQTDKLRHNKKIIPILQTITMQSTFVICIHILLHTDKFGMQTLLLRPVLAIWQTKCSPTTHMAPRGKSVEWLIRYGGLVTTTFWSTYPMWTMQSEINPLEGHVWKCEKFSIESNISKIRLNPCLPGLTRKWQFHEILNYFTFQEIGLPVGCISHRTAMHEMVKLINLRIYDHYNTLITCIFYK